MHLFKNNNFATSSTILFECLHLHYSFSKCFYAMAPKNEKHYSQQQSLFRIKLRTQRKRRER